MQMNGKAKRRMAKKRRTIELMNDYNLRLKVSLSEISLFRTETIILPNKIDELSSR